MKRKVVISYRRSDSAAEAGRLYDRLRADLGSDCLFMDVDNLAPGDDFSRVIERAIDDCAIALVVVGPAWVGASGTERRIDSPTDFVRMEVSHALRAGVPVVPVLVGGATVPVAAELPEDLRRLTSYQAVTLRHEVWAPAYADLLRRVRQAIGRPQRTRTLALLVAVGVALVAGGVLAGVLATRPRRAPIAAMPPAALLSRDGGEPARQLLPQARTNPMPASVRPPDSSSAADPGDRRPDRWEPCERCCAAWDLGFNSAVWFIFVVQKSDEAATEARSHVIARWAQFGSPWNSRISPGAVIEASRALVHRRYPEGSVAFEMGASLGSMGATIFSAKEQRQQLAQIAREKADLTLIGNGRLRPLFDSLDFDAPPEKYRKQLMSLAMASEQVWGCK